MQVLLTLRFRRQFHQLAPEILHSELDPAQLYHVELIDFVALTRNSSHFNYLLAVGSFKGPDNQPDSLCRFFVFRTPFLERHVLNIELVYRLCK